VIALPWVAEPAQADSYFDVLARLVDSLPSLVTAAAGAAVAIAIARKGAARHEETAKKVDDQAATIQGTAQKVDDQAATIEEIRESTVNSHQRPMRYDLDDVATDVGEVKSLVETIGAEVREDRKARRTGDESLASRLDALAIRLDRQDEIAAKHHPEDTGQ